MDHWILEMIIRLGEGRSTAASYMLKDSPLTSLSGNQ